MTIYAIEIDHPERGWVRMQAKYRTRYCAATWIEFVRDAWHGLPARIVAIEVAEKLPTENPFKHGSEKRSP